MTARSFRIGGIAPIYLGNHLPSNRICHLLTKNPAFAGFILQLLRIRAFLGSPLVSSHQIAL